MNNDPQRKRELGAIHVARKALALDDGTYRALLIRVTGLSSSAEMDGTQRRAVIDEFRRLGFNRAPGKPHRAPAPNEALVGKIRALWRALYNLGAVRADAALDAFVKRQTGRDALRFLTVRDANKVIEGLKAMCARAGFAQPLPEDAVAIDTWRDQAGMAPGGRGFAARVKLIEAQWQALIASGAMEHGSQAKLETWLRARFGVAAPWFLYAATADSAIEQLGAWLREMKKSHHEAPSTRGQTPAAQDEERGEPT